MKKDEWVEQIIENCNGVGTYRKEFDDAIDTLASILEKRDLAEATFNESDGKLVVLQNGGKTSGINPLLRVWADLNTQALAYWRDLGLTPSGLKKLNEKALTLKATKGIDDVVEALLQNEEL